MSSSAETFQRAWQHHQANEVAQAEQLYRQVLQCDPRHADAWCFLGAACQARGNSAEAEQCFRRAVQLVPTYATAHNYLGIVLAQQGQLDEAAACFQQALRWEPGLADAVNNLGLVRQRQGRINEAIAHYQEALRINPELRSARANLEKAVPQHGRNPPVVAPSVPGGSATAAQAYQRRGIELGQQGRLEESRAHLAEALRLQPDLVDGHVNLGTVLMLLGRHEEAASSYERELQLRPDHAVAYYNLGVVMEQRGKHAEACAAYRQAVRLRPDHVDAQNNLGNVLRRLEQFAEAEACYRQALRSRPNAGGILINLGRALQAQGKLDEALDCWQQALRVEPASAELHFSLATTLRDQGRLDQAEAAYREALRLRPDYPDAYNNLGLVLGKLGHFAEAEACYRQALRLRPDWSGIYLNLGQVLHDQGKLDEALDCWQQALRLEPGSADLHFCLATTLRDQGRLDQAEAAYRQALQLRPDYPEAYNNLGIALQNQGRLDEALICYRRALELQPRALYHSNVLYALHFHSGTAPASLAEEHRSWNRQHAEPFTPGSPTHANDPDPERRLRLGFVSPDFRCHPIGIFLLPLLEALDRRQLEICCYSSVTVPDELTARLHGLAGGWRDVARLTDEQLADCIRQDQIDILVDLTAHMSRNRLLTFARKPAPVQVTYLAYCSTTGLRTMDYRLTDPYLDPRDPEKGPEKGTGPVILGVPSPFPAPFPDQPQGNYSETSVWLPETYWCYRPSIDAPAVAPLPALQTGHITFGCLNNFFKVTAPTLAAWRELLRVVPTAQLVLHAHVGGHRDRVRAFFAEGGIAPERITFAGFMTLPEYLGLYGRIDIGLDPFPYGGGTTTCDALWMGVPVISRAGGIAVSRSGLSILSNTGIPELVAYTPEEYVRLAADLAGDRPRLADLRASLRQRVQQSPLADAPRFAANMHTAFRTMWRTWCARQ